MHAQVVELVYTPVLGTGRVICGGSSPLLGTNFLKKDEKWERVGKREFSVGGSLKPPRLHQLC